MLWIFLCSDSSVLEMLTCLSCIFFAVLTVAQYLVLAEKEGQQHQHASIMDDPPNVNVTLSEALSIGREGSNVLRDEQSQVSGSGFSDQLCRTDTYRERWRYQRHYCYGLSSLLKLVSQK